MKILIADIDHETIEYVRIALNLRQSDWHISSTNSGGKCLDIVMSNSCPDVVILGIQLSDIDGLTLSEKIRNDSDVPIVVLSCSKDMETMLNAFDSGANYYIVKPFNKNIFVSQLKALIRRMKWDLRKTIRQSMKADSFKEYSNNYCSELFKQLNSNQIIHR